MANLTEDQIREAAGAHALEEGHSSAGTSFEVGAKWALSKRNDNEHLDQWVACSERLPEDNSHKSILINGDRNSTHHIYYTAGYDALYKEWTNPFGYRIEENVTHWKSITPKKGADHD